MSLTLDDAAITPQRPEVLNGDAHSDDVSSCDSVHSSEFDTTRYAGTHVSVVYSRRHHDDVDGAFHMLEVESVDLPSPKYRSADDAHVVRDPNMMQLFNDMQAKRSLAQHVRGITCCFLGPRNRVRKGCLRFVKHNSTQRFIIAVAFLNCIFLSSANPSIEPGAYANFVSGFEMFAIYFYLCELAMYVVATGVVEETTSFLRYSWFNQFDFFLIVASVIGLWSDLPPLRHLHVFRALKLFPHLQRERPTWLGNNRAVVDTIRFGFVNLLRVTVFLVFFLVLFAIVGVEAFQGSYSRRCFVPTEAHLRNVGGEVNDACRNSTTLAADCRAVVPELFCKDTVAVSLGGWLDQTPCPDPRMVCRLGTAPDSGYTSFDNIGTALLVLANIATLNNWGQLLAPLMEAESKLLATLYFLSVIVTVTFVVINMYTAVVTSRYLAVKAHFEHQAAHLADKMQAMALKSIIPNVVEIGPIRTSVEAPVWSHIGSKRVMLWRCLSQKPIPRWHTAAQGLIRARSFRFGVHVTIIANLVLQATLSRKDLELSDLCFLMLCITEMVLRLVGAGSTRADAHVFGVARFVHNPWNVVDICLVLVSSITWPAYRTGWTYLRAVRLLRSVRLMDYRGLQRSLNSVLASLKPICELLLMVGIVIFIVCAFAIPTFATRYTPGYSLESVPVRENFDTFFGSMLTIFTLITGDNWSSALYFTADRYEWFAPVFFLLLYAFFVFVFVSIFTSIVLEHLQLGERTQNSRREAVVFGIIREHLYPTPVPCTFRESIDAWLLWLDSVWHRFMDVVLDDDDDDDDDVALYREHTQQQQQQQQAVIERTAVANQILADKEEQFIQDLCVQREMANETNATEGGNDADAATPPWVVDQTSLYIFSEQNLLRRMCIAIVTRYKLVFSTIILLAILLSCLTLGMDPPKEAVHTEDASKDREVKWINTVDYVLLGVFALEAAVKIIANGWLYGIERGDRVPYARDPWNRVDFILLILMSVSLFFPDARAVRMLRAFRPFKIVRRSERFRVVFAAILRSTAGVFHVICFLLFFVLLFAITGYKLFAGQLGYCTNTASWVTSRAECTGVYTNSIGILAPATWAQPRSNFETIPKAMLSVFEVSTLSDWVTIMYTVTDVRGNDKVPERGASSYNGVYMVCVIVVQAYILTNVFVGVLLQCFDEERGLVALTTYQQEWLQIRQLVNASSAFRVRWYLYFKASTALSRRLASVVLHHNFELASNIIVVCNVFTMASAHAGQPDTWGRFLAVTDGIFLTFYVLECAMKLYVLRPRVYFTDPWNIFDVSVVVGNLAAYLVLAVVAGGGGAIALLMKSFSRFFRCLRVLKLAKSNVGNLQFLFTSLVQSIPSILSVLVLLVVVLFIAAVFATNLFGNVRFYESLNKNWNFRGVAVAMLTLLRALTADDWNLIMHDVARRYPYCTDNDVRNDCGGISAIAFFLLFGVAGTTMVLPIIMAVIIDNFNVCYAQFSYAITNTHLAEFRREFERSVVFFSEDDGDAEGLSYPQLELLLCILHARGNPLTRNLHPRTHRFQFRRLIFDLDEIRQKQRGDGGHGLFFGTAQCMWNGLLLEKQPSSNPGNNNKYYTFRCVLAALVTHQGGSESLADPIARTHRRHYERARDESLAHDVIARALRRWLRGDVWRSDPSLTVAENTRKARLWQGINTFTSMALSISQKNSAAALANAHQCMRELSVPQNPIRTLFGVTPSTAPPAEVDDDDIDSSTSTLSSVIF